MNLLETITRQAEADSAALMVPDESGGYTYCYASYNMPPEWTAIKNSYHEDIPGGNVEVYRTGKPAVTNHLAKYLEGHYIESVMIVPIKRDGQTIAMLELVHSKDGKVFSKRDLKAIQEFTNKLAEDIP